MFNFFVLALAELELVISGFLIGNSVGTMMQYTKDSNAASIGAFRSWGTFARQVTSLQAKKHSFFPAVIFALHVRVLFSNAENFHSKYLPLQRIHARKSTLFSTVVEKILLCFELDYVLHFWFSRQAFILLFALFFPETLFIQT